MKRREVAGLAAAIGAGAGLTALLRSREPAVPPSPHEGRPAPPLEGERLDDPAQRFSSATLQGRTWMLNVWASWCAPCIEEHPLLLALARDRGAHIVGLNFADQRGPARAFLARLGDPFAVTLFDPEGSHAAAWAVQAVPQTFLVDGTGVIRTHVAGRLTERAVRERFAPHLIPPKS